MSQSHIILVRHGEASAEWSVHLDPGLSAKGRGQAKNSGKSLVNELSCYQLLSSPKKRAIETMEIMNKGYKNSFELDHRFIEIPSSNVDADKKKEWLVSIFTTPIEELPETVTEWRNKLIDWLRDAEGNYVIWHGCKLNAENYEMDLPPWEVEAYEYEDRLLEKLGVNDGRYNKTQH